MASRSRKCRDRKPFATRLLFPLWLFTVAFAGTGCSGEIEESKMGPVGATPPNVLDSAGVRIVENRESQWAPGSEWRVGPILTSIGESDRGLAYELFRAMDATRLSDGTVAVVNSDTGEIRFFAEGGTFLRSVGSTGGGPGEFRGAGALRDLERIAGDTLIAWDLYGQIASVFAPDGTFVRSFGLDGSAQRNYFGGIFSDGSLLMKTIRHAPSKHRETMPEEVVRYDVALHFFGVDHRLVHTHRGILDKDIFQARWGDFGWMSTEAPFGRVTSVGVGEGRVYVSTGEEDEISVYGQSGVLEMSIQRLLDPVPVTPAMINEDRARRLEQESDWEEVHVEPRVRRMIEALPYPEFLPPYGLSILDSELHLWVEEFRANVDARPDWSVFDPDGIWLGRVRLPEGLEVYEIGEDYILGRWRDGFEVEHIRVYRLEKGSAEAVSGG